MWPEREILWLGAGLTLLGWVWGSFINQVVDRTPRRGNESGGGEGGGKPGPVTLLKPLRSICFTCGRGIPWYENIPVLSYLLLRGACRRCGAAIGRRTLLMEVAVPAAFAGSYWLSAGQGGIDWETPWRAALEYSQLSLLLGLLLSWLLLAAALLAERRRLGLILWLLPAAALALAWVFLSGRN